MRLLLVLLLAGCAATPKWSKPGASNQDFYRDEAQCQEQARPSPKGSIVQPTFDACMVAKGYMQK